MARPFPYTFIACTCSELERLTADKRRSLDLRHLLEGENEADEDKTFNSHDPRSSFSLFPPEHMLYCEECQDLKCPRCVKEEILSWYCPTCLFEAPSTQVRGDGMRCTRNCLDCPLCMSQLSVVSLDPEAREPCWILNCNYCMWTSLDIGIQFDKPTSIRTQLDKVLNGGKPKPPSKVSDTIDVSRKTSAANPLSPLGPSRISSFPFPKQEPPPPTVSEGQNEPLDHHARFAALRTFYKEQAMSSEEPNRSISTVTGLDYSSPSSINRLMSLYSGLGVRTKPKAPQPMREALSASEGLVINSPSQPSHPQDGNGEATTTVQRRFQLSSLGLGNPDAHCTAQLRPMPTRLRTRRSKRCSACRHILSKPSPKPAVLKYSLRLVAQNYIPLVSLKPLPPPDIGTGNADRTRYKLSRDFNKIDGGDIVLDANRTSQWILTLKNHLFDKVRVSLATPSVTPGRFGHKVTILCPVFEIGANSEVWDDALVGGGGKQAEQSVAEAGKLYDKGRNWVSVVIEVVPGSVHLGGNKDAMQTQRGGALEMDFAKALDEDGDEDGEQGNALKEDEDVLEIPIRVRLEWTQTALDDEKKKPKSLGQDGEDESSAREVAYWMVLGVGKVEG